MTGSQSSWHLDWLSGHHTLPLLLCVHLMRKTMGNVSFVSFTILGTVLGVRKYLKSTRSN